MADAETIKVITVDGPGGAGKGTLCYQLANALGWHLLDSGALYRVLALAAESHGVKFENEEALQVLAGHLDVQFRPAVGKPQCDIVLEGELVGEELRSERCGENASILAAYRGVRTALLDRQRAFREAPGLVADGRDMGTVVFPNAELKVFLTASAEERAKRRYKQLKQKGFDVSLRGLFEDIRNRDGRDASRALSPLVPAEDAMVLDSTALTIEQVFQKVLAQAKSRELL